MKTIFYGETENENGALYYAIEGDYSHLYGQKIYLQYPYEKQICPELFDLLRTEKIRQIRWDEAEELLFDNNNKLVTFKVVV